MNWIYFVIKPTMMVELNIIGIKPTMVVFEHIFPGNSQLAIVRHLEGDGMTYAVAIFNQTQMIK